MTCFIIIPVWWLNCVVFLIHSLPRQPQRTRLPNSLPLCPSPPLHRVSPPRGSTASHHSPPARPPWTFWGIWGGTLFPPRPHRLRACPQAAEEGEEKVCVPYVSKNDLLRCCWRIGNIWLFKLYRVPEIEIRTIRIFSYDLYLWFIQVFCLFVWGFFVFFKHISYIVLVICNFFFYFQLSVLALTDYRIE